LDELLKTYLANLYIDDLRMALRYEAMDEDEAISLAEENDWEYLGEFLWEEEVPEDVMAMIEYRVTNPVVH
jgi:hypothetical protein